MLYTLIFYLASFTAIIFIFSPHEFAHAYVAYKCGDPTAKMRGRLTLNPIKHLDPYGYILCALAGFGWAKPVPINPFNFRSYRKGLFLTAVSGVIANYIIALLAYPLFLTIYFYFPTGISAGLDYVGYFLRELFYLVFLYSLGVFVFNLLPFNPLDGFRVVEALTREVNPVHRFLKNYGFYILIILVVESFLCGLILDYTTLYWVRYLDILGYVQWFARNILGYPIMALWNAVFRLPMPIIAPY